MTISTKTSPTSEDGFREYRREILSDIKRLNSIVGKLQEVMTSMVIDIGGLKHTERIRAVVWGNIGGIVAATLVTLLATKLFP